MDADDEPERSVVFATTGSGRIPLLHVSEERFDSCGTSYRIVLLELNLWGDSQSELPRNARPQMGCDAVESIESRLLLGVAAEHAHVHPGMPEVGTHLGSRHCDEANDARILCRFSEESRYLDADRFGDAVRSTRVTQMRPPLK